jgi:hypothetical protein
MRHIFLVFFLCDQTVVKRIGKILMTNKKLQLDCIEGLHYLHIYKLMSKMIADFTCYFTMNFFLIFMSKIYYLKSFKVFYNESSV